MSKIRPRIRIELANGEVKYFLAKCEERRLKSKGRQPNMILWENRPRWNGSTINPTPVVGGAGRAFSVVPCSLCLSA